jgi:hypothetical protein
MPATDQAWHKAFRRQTNAIQRLRNEAEQMLGDLEERDRRRSARGSETKRRMAEKYTALQERTRTED